VEQDVIFYNVEQDVIFYNVEQYAILRVEYEYCGMVEYSRLGRSKPTLKPIIPNKK
jgi:hypothetical protein